MCSNIQKSRVVFGTAAIYEAKEPFQLLDAAFSLGVRKYDLARTYGLGKSETIFGSWMKDRNIPRSDIYIITKGGMGKDKYGDPNRPLLSRQSIQVEINSSLDALQVSNVDLWMYHRDDPRLPVDQFVIWANELINQEKISAWGVSNWSFERFQKAHNFALSQGFVPPSANSPQLSLAVPACEIWPTSHSISGHEHEGQLVWYHTKGVELICWEVLAKGFMAVPDLWPEHSIDKVFLDKVVEIGSDEWRLQRLQRAYCHDENYRRRRNALKIAKENGMTLAQIAALYALSKSPTVSVILGFLEPKQIEDIKDLHFYWLDKNSILCENETSEERKQLIDLRESFAKSADLNETVFPRASNITYDHLILNPDIKI
jgi:aryl-alcohol dehydrogenase-like predicted oxidoreductase